MFFHYVQGSGKKNLVFRLFPIIYNMLTPFYFSFIVKSVKQSLDKTAADCIKKGVDHTNYFFHKMFMRM